MVTLKFKTFSEFREFAKHVKEERERAEGQTPPGYGIAARCCYLCRNRTALVCRKYSLEVEDYETCDTFEEAGRVTDAEAVELWGHSGPKAEGA